MRPINIEGSERYMIDEDGNVFNVKSKRKLTSWFDARGYSKISICIYNKQKSFSVHRLLMLTFRYKDGCEELEVNHRDGIKTNNKLSNLEWATRKENMQHAFKTGLACTAKGETNGNSRITEAQARSILAELKAGISQRKIAKKYGIGQTAISRINQRKMWAHVAI